MTLLIDDVRRMKLDPHPFCGPDMTYGVQEALGNPDVVAFSADNAANLWFDHYPTADAQRALLRGVNVLVPFGTFWMETRMSGDMAKARVQSIAPNPMDRPEQWGVLVVVTDLWEKLKLDQPDATDDRLGALARNAYNDRILTVDPGLAEAGEDLTARMLVEDPLRYLYECHIVFKHRGDRHPAGPVATTLVPLTPEGRIAVAFDERSLAIQGYLNTTRLTPEQRRRASDASVVWSLPFLFACGLIRSANVTTVEYRVDPKLARAHQRRSGADRAPWHVATIDGDRRIPPGMFVVHPDGTQTWEAIE
jgi:hypothetical protein